jgi:hypothetical protein
MLCAADPEPKEIRGKGHHERVWTDCPRGPPQSSPSHAGGISAEGDWIPCCLVQGFARISHSI